MDPDQLASNPENPPDEIASGDVLPTAAPETHEAERESGETGGESVSEPELAKATDEQRPILQSLSGWGFGSGFSWGKVMESGGSLMQTVKRQTEAVVDVYRKCVWEGATSLSSVTIGLQCQRYQRPRSSRI